MKKILLIAGMPGSGKTHLSRLLSRELGLPVVCKDEIKELLFDDIGFDSPEKKRQLDTAAAHCMAYLARRTMDSGGGLILENNFGKIDYEWLDSLFKGSGFAAVTVLLVAEIRALYDRLCARNYAPDRHPGHSTDTKYPVAEGEAFSWLPKLEYDVFERIVDELGVRDFRYGETITVDTTDFAAVDYAEITKQVKQLLK